jgi:hypothetical protein
MAAGKTLLIGIGAPKAGTSWLAAYLAHHPEVFMSPIKELHYFDTVLLPNMCGAFDRRLADDYRTLAGSWWRRFLPTRTQAEKQLIASYVDRLGMRGEDDYLRYFLSRVGDRKVMCEITPSYSLLSREGFARIAGLHPAVKFIYLLRNPVDRIWSRMRFGQRPDQIARGYRDVSFDIDTELANPQTMLRTDYRRTLTELFGAVDREKVFVAFYERLFNDDTMHRFCAFLGIAFRSGDYVKTVNPSPSRDLAEGDRARMYRALAPVYEYVNRLFDGDIPESWLRDMDAYAVAA